jgi:signal transduction histidine kinase
MSLERIRREAVQTERHRIALELHDSLGQTFTGITLQLEAALESLGEDTGAAAHTRRALRLARTGFREMRRALHNLRPEVLEKEDLPKALARISKEISDGSALEVQLSVTGRVRRLPPEAEADLLRISEEALTNVVRHADARRARITLHFGYRTVLLCITDDGKGFRARPHKRSLGLISIQERVNALGGDCSVQSSRGRGTQISVSIPLPM